MVKFKFYKSILYLVVFFIGCKSSNQSKKDQWIEEIKNFSLIEKTLMKQVVREGFSYYFLDYTLDDLKATAEQEQELLHSNGYKSIDDFKKRVEEIFKIKSEDSILVFNKFEKTWERLREEYSLDEGAICNYYYIFIKEQVFTDFIKLPYLVDYRTKYPHVAKCEDTISFVDPDELWFTWKSVESLPERRNDACKRIIHRNKYLFNDSKASLTWLINNDYSFLEFLVREFGFCKEPRINKIVLNNIYKEYAPKSSTGCLYDLFVSKDKFGNLDIREDLMKYILDNTTKEDNKLFMMLYDYGNHILHYKDVPFTDAEKYKIASYVGYYIELGYNKFEPRIYESDWYRASLLCNELSSNKDFYDEILKNDYYGLPDFSDILSGVFFSIKEATEAYWRSHPWAAPYKVSSRGYANLYESADSGSSVLKKIPADSYIKVYNQTDLVWWQVDYENKTGYMNSSSIVQEEYVSPVLGQ